MRGTNSREVTGTTGSATLVIKCSECGQHRCYACLGDRGTAPCSCLHRAAAITRQALDRFERSGNAALLRESLGQLLALRMQTGARMAKRKRRAVQTKMGSP